MPGKSHKNHTAGEGAYRFGEFDLYPAERRLHRKQRPLKVSPKVFDALLLFVRNAERLVRRDELIDTLWPDTYVTDANLTNVILSLRKTLGRRAIQTVSKFGYRFSLPVIGEPGVDEAVYTTFLQGRELATVRSLESMTRARDLFALCVTTDPQFAAGWAWLGRCYRFLDKFGAGPSMNLELAQAAFRRALAIDPQLACTHHFYTQLQADLGQAREAVTRLAQRIALRGGEPESFAGLVQALRLCGLLDESLVAHQHAVALDPTIVTSVPHTHFLRCEYEATLEVYANTGYYLDAASWAGLGDTRRAATLLSERLQKQQPLSDSMGGSMRSLLAILEGRRTEALSIINNLRVEREPELVFYLSRHLAMLGAGDECIASLQQARNQGMTSSYTLLHDDVFGPVRRRPDFQREVEHARALENEARQALSRARGRSDW
jgi:DNA-binding winged helix-turn-helix (wHTH) protein